MSKTHRCGAQSLPEIITVGLFVCYLPLVHPLDLRNLLVMAPNLRVTLLVVTVCAIVTVLLTQGPTQQQPLLVAISAEKLQQSTKKNVDNGYTQLIHTLYTSFDLTLWTYIKGHDNSQCVL